MHRRRLGAILLPLFVTIFIGMVVPGIARADLASKRQQAKQIMAQIDTLDTRLEVAIEQYNMANQKLSDLEVKIGDNKKHLDLAQKQLTLARKTLAARAVAIYKEQPVDFLDVVLQTQSFDELASQLDMMRRLSDNDSTVVDSIEKLKKDIATRRVALLSDEKQAKKLVSEKVAMKDQITSQLNDRQSLLKGVKKEIDKLEAQARAAARARALAAQQAAQAAQPSGYDVGIHSGAGSHSSVVAYAAQFVNRVPYVWGGASPAGFDCSGLTMYCYLHAAGISLPHNAAMQYASITHIARDSLQPGDLVFFGYSAAGIHHVGIYVGGGSMIEAPHTGAMVSYGSVFDRDFYGGGRP